MRLSDVVQAGRMLPFEIRDVLYDILADTLLRIENKEPHYRIESDWRKAFKNTHDLRRKIAYDLVANNVEKLCD